MLRFASERKTSISPSRNKNYSFSLHGITMENAHIHELLHCSVTRKLFFIFKTKKYECTINQTTDKYYNAMFISKPNIPQW